MNAIREGMRASNCAPNRTLHTKTPDGGAVGSEGTGLRLNLIILMPDVHASFRRLSAPYTSAPVCKGGAT